ncbi:MAG: uracil-DNA glycosylase [Oscillospiraceae bacterium]|nr:uracil-DNA glycosylase [Oscillospiraceae bacterium]
MFKIDNDWNELLSSEWNKPYFKDLSTFLENERRYHTVYPEENDVFAALKQTPYSEIKAVILGQDPYHGKGQAHGFCFSVKHGVTTPPSLRNIFKELQVDCSISQPEHGNLTLWAKKGVLLLNSVLTVRQGEANSHKSRGWEIFTDQILTLCNKREPIVFILWGEQAKKKSKLLANPNNLVLTGSHPSPLSANRGGFFGGQYFSKTNDFLESRGVGGIDWRLD